MFANWGAAEIIVLIYIFLTPVFWIIALVDIVGRRYDGITKFKWIMVVMFLPLLGSVIYLLINKRKVAV